MILTRANLFENIVMRLSVLSYVVRAMSKRNLTDENRGCEKFFCGVLNQVFDYSLEDLNEKKVNAAAVDLGDKTARICFQVTATSSSSKVDKTLEKFVKHHLFDEYDTLKFLMLVEKKNYSKEFDTQGKFSFDKKKDILDIDDLLESIEKLSLDKLQSLSDYVEEHSHGLTKSLLPSSLLAQAEKTEGQAPAGCDAFLSSLGTGPGKDWQESVAALRDLHGGLKALSGKQRELIAFMVEHGTRSKFGSRVSIGIQTLQQKLNLTDLEMQAYYRALSAKGLIDVDEEGFANNFEISFRLNPHVDAFMALKEYLGTHEKYQKVFVNCDFSVLN